MLFLCCLYLCAAFSFIILLTFALPVSTIHVLAARQQQASPRANLLPPGAVPGCLSLRVQRGGRLLASQNFDEHVLYFLLRQ